MREKHELRYSRPDPTGYPRVCPEIEPIGGLIRHELEDFCVEEIPLYSFCGQGEHCYVTLKKFNRTTLQVRDFLAKTLNVFADDVGFAGFKDKRGVTTQTFSILGAEEEQLRAIDVPWVEILAVTRHRNKLRPGHLKGNRFRIVVRDVREGALAAANEMIAILKARGLPNFFGHQRFGRNHVGALVGCDLLHRNVKGAVDLILGPTPGLGERFRHLYAEEKYEEALEALPPGRRMEANLLQVLRRYPGNHRAAARRIPRQMRRMYFSAYQSFLFNWALRERLEWSPDAVRQVVEGDLAFVHEKGACFIVENPDEEQPRADRGEISPSGPMFGRRMTFPTHRPGALEWAILEAEGLRPQSFLSHFKGLKLDGARRPYRIPISEVQCEEIEPRVLALEFTLPAGSYATTLLDQLMGPGQVELRSFVPAEPGD